MADSKYIFFSKKINHIFLIFKANFEDINFGGNSDSAGLEGVNINMNEMPKGQTLQDPSLNRLENQ